MSAAQFFGLLAAIYLSPRLSNRWALAFAVVFTILQAVTAYAEISTTWSAA